MSDDRAQIVDLLNLYGLAVDARRWDLFDDIFTADIDVDYTNGRHWSDLASFKVGFAAAHEPLHHTQHAMSNHVVRIGDGVAAAFTYVSFRLVRRTENADDVTEGTACYDDALKRTAGRWLIDRRLCRITWRRHFQISAREVEQLESEFATQQVKQVSNLAALTLR